MGFFCRNQGRSTSKHLMSRPRFSYRDKNFFLHCLFCLNKLFHVAEVSVATEEGSIVIGILPSIQHYVATQTILFPGDLHMFFPFTVATCCLLSRPSSIVNNQIMVLRHKNCCCDSVSLVIAWKFVATHKFQSQHRLLQLLFFFSLLSYWNFLFFELNPAKHKFGKYSIIWH